jgi:hypothetical protein
MSKPDEKSHAPEVPQEEHKAEEPKAEKKPEEHKPEEETPKKQSGNDEKKAGDENSTESPKEYLANSGLQHLFETITNRALVERPKDALLFVQTVVNELVAARKDDKKEKKDLSAEEAAVKIQSVQRGIQARQEVEKKKEAKKGEKDEKEEKKDEKKEEKKDDKN